MEKRCSCYFLLLFISIVILTQGCYRMPQDGEVSVVPVTNNPAVTRQSSSPLLPSMY